MRRREILLLGGALASWSLAARGQQSAIPVIGFLSSLAQKDLIFVMPAFHEGLTGAGFVEGRNVSIEYRLAEGDYHRLPALSADLVRIIRFSPPKCYRDCCNQWHASRISGKGCHNNHSDRIRDRG
jgi:hypothetical protein